MTSSAEKDPVQEAIGPIGRWQIIMILALSLKNFPSAWNQLAIVVISPRQDFTCVSPAPVNLNDSMLGACTVIVNESIPEVKCAEFAYDDSTFRSTIVSEWDLVCDRKYLRGLVQPSTQLGVLIGNLLFGVLADRIGRKTPLMIAIIILATAGITTAFMPTFELFLLFKFITSIAVGGAMLISYVIVIEIVGQKIRSNILVLFHLPFILGILSVPGISYLTRTWNGYWLAIAAPTFVLLSYYWLIPESPRWLLAVGKVEQAREVLLKIAEKNKISKEKVTAAIESIATESIETKSEQKTYSIFDLMRTPVLRLRTLIIIFQWFKGGMVFFGIEQYVGRMSENVLSNLAISATFQLPGLLLVYILISRVSRLKIIICGNILCGISLLLIIPFYNNDTAKLVLVTIGITSMGVGSPTLHLYTGEVFPTVVRNAGLAVCSVTSKLGTIVAPLIVEYMDDLAYWVVPLIFGLCPILAAVLCYFLPETINCKLPETIEDAENFKNAETWTLTKETVHRMRVAQRAMECTMLGITLLDHIPNTKIRKQTKVNDVS